MARHAGPEARRDHVQLRRAARAEQGTPRPRDDARDGQGPRRGAGRRPGGRRHRVPDGGGGPAHVRRHRAVRAAQQVGDEHPPADRRRRHHHALELPDRDPVLEDDRRADLRQHGRAQAGQRHAALRGAARRDHARGRFPAGRREHGHGFGRGSGHAPRREPGRERDLVHRQRRDRPADRHRGGTWQPTALARAGRQERDRRHGRRGPGPRRRWHPLVRFRHHWAALHRVQSAGR